MASRGINKVIIVGNLGDDPTIRYTQNNVAIATLSVATTEQWRDKNSGEDKSITEWHRCVAHRRLAEVCGEYLKKGSKVYIEGRLQTRRYQTQDGIERYTTEIIVKDLQMLDSKGAGGSQQQPSQQPRQQQSQPSSHQDFVPDDDFSDVPF